MRARCEGNWSPQTSQFSVEAHSSSLGMTGSPTILHASAEAAISAGMVENRSSQMSFGVLSPASAAHTSADDAGPYNTGAVLPQGAFDVQTIRAAQTADSRAKQTCPSGPARRSAKVNSRPGDSDSPDSMPAGHFHLEEVVESFLGQPLLASLPAAALQRASPLRTWTSGGSASTSHLWPLSWSTSSCSSP